MKNWLFHIQVIPAICPLPVLTCSSSLSSSTYNLSNLPAGGFYNNAYELEIMDKGQSTHVKRTGAILNQIPKNYFIGASTGHCYKPGYLFNRGILRNMFKNTITIMLIPNIHSYEKTFTWYDFYFNAFLYRAF